MTSGCDLYPISFVWLNITRNPSRPPQILGEAPCMPPGVLITQCAHFCIMHAYPDYKLPKRAGLLEAVKGSFTCCIHSFWYIIIIGQIFVKGICEIHK